MTDAWHQDAANANTLPRPTFALPPMKTCANCTNFARLANPIGELHGICGQNIVARGYAPVVSETDGRYCVSFNDGSDAKTAEAIRRALEGEEAA